jgi:hypothetical protein
MLKTKEQDRNRVLPKDGSVKSAWLRAKLLSVVRIFLSLQAHIASKWAYIGTLPA